MFSCGCLSSVVVTHLLYLLQLEDRLVAIGAVVTRLVLRVQLRCDVHIFKYGYNCVIVLFVTGGSGQLQFLYL